jgi:hypothetical protein
LDKLPLLMPSARATSADEPHSCSASLLCKRGTHQHFEAMNEVM